MTDQVISHYRILEHLAAGGMGEVFLAEDTTLGRRVALKFLPAEQTQGPERLRRFRQEAKAASADDSLFAIGCLRPRFDARVELSIASRSATLVTQLERIT